MARDRGKEEPQSWKGIAPPSSMADGIPEEISREALRERERCVELIWQNRGKCASNQAALALMNLINGSV